MPASVKLQSVKLDADLVTRYRKASEANMMPISRMIERAMRDWLPVYENMGRKITKLFGPEHSTQKGGQE